jgi:hypothetical protein
MSRYNLGKDDPRIHAIEHDVAEIRSEILTHRLYSLLESRADVMRFMEIHVFAVWDFMSLLKRLQQHLTCVNVPWVPAGPGASRRLINEIVLVEESDAYSGAYLSHFELYLRAMQEAGANDMPMQLFLNDLRRRANVSAALGCSGAHRAATDFVTTTWHIIENAPLHAQAAAFAFGREHLIPAMFDRLISIGAGEGLTTFCDYLVRHIAVDGEEHTPMAMQLVIDLCGDAPHRWEACSTTVQRALRARVALWDGIAAALEDARERSLHYARASGQVG